MNYKRLMRFMPNERKEQLQKVIDTLRIGGRSEKTISNYVHAINRFFEYFKNEDISKFNEDDIIEYIKQNYLSKSCAGSTYNMNICAIKYFIQSISIKNLIANYCHMQNLIKKYHQPLIKIYLLKF